MTGKFIWGFIGLLLLVFFVSVKAILLPFLAGLALAYFLDPLADKLEALRVPRGLATVFILSAFFIILTGVVLALWPLLLSQGEAFAKFLPQSLSKIKPWLYAQLDFIQGFGGGILSDQIAGADVESLLALLSQKFFAQLEYLLAGLLREGVAFFNILSLLLITPMVAFYLLRDWDILIAKIDQLLPQAMADDIRQLAQEMDHVLAGFVRGQISVCVIMAVLYSFGWGVIGLDFALIIGLFAGLLSFIPFVGPLFGFLLALATGMGQWGFMDGHIIGIIAVYGIVQALESMILTPRLVGGHVGLHPVWIIFALLAGGEILGFTGVLIAVPAAAVIAVLMRYGKKYYVSRFKTGVSAFEQSSSQAPAVEVPIVETSASLAAPSVTGKK